MRRLGAQEIDDLGKSVLGLADECGSSVLAVEVHLPAIPGEDVRHLHYRQHEIDRARRDRAPRHAVVARVARVLRDDEPAFLFHRLQPEAAVGSRSRKNYTDGALADLFGQ
jgi:hypothetical protein